MKAGLAAIHWDRVRLGVWLTFAIKDAVQVALAVQSGTATDYFFRFALAIAFFYFAAEETETIARRVRA